MTKRRHYRLIACLLLWACTPAQALEGLWFYERNFREEGIYDTGVIINLDDMYTSAAGVRQALSYRKGEQPNIYISTQHPSDRIELLGPNALLYLWKDQKPQKFYRAIAITEHNASGYLTGKWSWDSTVCGGEYYSFNYAQREATYIWKDSDKETLAFSVKGNEYHEEGSTFLFYHIPELNALVAVAREIVQDGERLPDTELDQYHTWSQRCK